MSEYIEIRTLQAGQLRPYADHQFVVELTFRRDEWHTKKWREEHNVPDIVPYYIGRSSAFEYAKIACPFVEKDDPKGHWASRFLVSFDRMEPSVSPAHEVMGVGPVSREHSDRWRIHVTAAFTD